MKYAVNKIGIEVLRNTSVSILDSEKILRNRISAVLNCIEVQSIDSDYYAELYELFLKLDCIMSELVIQAEELRIRANKYNEIIFLDDFPHTKKRRIKNEIEIEIAEEKKRQMALEWLHRKRIIKEQCKDEGVDEEVYKDKIEKEKQIFQKMFSKQK